MHKNVGETQMVVFHTHAYLNFHGSGADPNHARKWGNGWIKRFGHSGKTAKRKYYSTPHTDSVTDRIIYLVADLDLATGKEEVNLCAVLFADEDGSLSMLRADQEIDHTGLSARVITIPSVVNGKKVKYIALASKVQVSDKDVEDWIKHLAKSPAPESGYDYLGYHFRWADFDYEFTFLGRHEIEIETGTNPDGENETITLEPLKVPVFDPLKMASTMAKKLAAKIKGFEKEFGFHKPLVNKHSGHPEPSAIEADAKRWSNYRLALMLDQAQEPDLQKQLKEIRPALNVFLNGRKLVQQSHQRAVDLAAANLACWLGRDVVMAWINLCHGAGIVKVSKEPGTGSKSVASAKICILEDFAKAIEDLHQTRPGNVFGEVLAARASSYSVFDDYLFSGKAMTDALKFRKVLESTTKVHKLVFGRLVARGKKNLAGVLKVHGKYLVDAGVVSDADEFADVSSAALTFLSNGAPGTVSGGKLKVQRAAIKLKKLKSVFGKIDAATSALEMLAWFEVMENIRAYTELANSSKGATALDGMKLATAVASQAHATADLLLGQTLAQGSKMGLKVAVSALGVVVNAADAALKAHESDELAKKGDMDAAAFMFASAVCVMLAIPFGLFGWWVGAAVAIIGGILGIIAELVTDDTWEIFIAQTQWGAKTGKATAKPDWTGGYTLGDLRGNAALQVRALANLLNNFTVYRLGGGISDKFGRHTLVIEMATPDPRAIFLVEWSFQVSGDATIHKRLTVAATFAGPGKQVDGKAFRIPGAVHDPNGKSLETHEHSWAQDRTSTSLLIGEPLDMRAASLPGHKWQHKFILGLEVEVRRLASQCFAMPHSTKAWTHVVKLDLRATSQKSRLFDNA